MNRIRIALQVDDIDHSIVAYRRDAGPDLILALHGLGCSGNTFRDMWDHSSFSQYSLLVPDLPGYGESSRPKSFSYSMPGFARVCGAILDDFEYRSLHIIGHSMGGAIGLLLPAKYRDGLASFVNVEGNLTPEDCVWASRRACSVPYHEFLSGIFPEFVSAFIRDERRYHALDEASPFAFYHSSASLVEWSDSGRILDSFRSMKCDRLYVYGSRNRDHPTVSAISGIETLEIPEGGHFSMIDNPPAFYEGVASFLERVDQTLE
jgi:pimeloyl-ACP methyl ester carboxylesterase